MTNKRLKIGHDVLFGALINNPAIKIGSLRVEGSDEDR
jgi:hypothetical protein